MRPSHSIVLLIVVASLQSSRAQQQPERVSIEIANIRWQQPPKEVYSVVVGPDGRKWYQLNGDSTGRSSSSIRNLLEAEYRQPSPQISGATIALLEPSGRAWFFINRARMLWGFDGKEWIEHAAPPNSNFVGTCPTLGQLSDNVSNRFAAGKACFRDWQGIHVFDGMHWSYEPFFPRTSKLHRQPHFAISPNGRYCAAVVQRRDERNNNVGADLWAFQEGKWHKRDSALNNQSGTVGAFCVTNEGVLWFVWNYKSLRYLPMSDERPSHIDKATEAQVAALVEQLGNDDFAIREKVMGELQGRGAAIKPQLEAAQNLTSDAETKARLTHLLRKLNDQQSGQGLESVQIGNCSVQNVATLFQDDEGRIYVFANDVSVADEKNVKGLAIVNVDGKAKLIQFADNLVSMRSVFDSAAPILMPDRNGMWLTLLSTGFPVRRLDFLTKQMTGELPDPRFAYVQAVDSEGNVFVSRQQPSVFGTSATVLGIFRPGAREPNSVLQVASADVAHSNFLVASDGTVWAHREGEGLARYDGKKWEVVHFDDYEHQTPMLAGLNEIVIARARKGYKLLQGDQLLGEGELRDLVQRNRNAIAPAFPPHLSLLSDQTFGFQIATDTSGNIWLLDQQQVSVLVGNEWIEANESLTAAGSRLGGARFMAAVGDGSKLYLSDLMLVHDRGTSFLAELKDGAIHVSAAPHGYQTFGMPLPLRDLEGGLWIPRYIAVSAGTSDRIIGQCSTRLSERGTMQEITNHYPILLDRSGNVWLIRVRPSEGSQLQIWRKGKVIQTLDLPGTDTLYSIFSDKPDSVYAWTPLGLQHLTANSTDETYQFQARKTYSMPPLPKSRPRGDRYSSRGYLVIPSSADFPRKNKLFFVTLPDK